MAASAQFTTVLNRADAFSFSSVRGFKSRNLIRTSSLRSVKRSFYVRNVSSEPELKAKDSLPDEVVVSAVKLYSEKRAVLPGQWHPSVLSVLQSANVMVC